MPQPPHSDATLLEALEAYTAHIAQARHHGDLVDRALDGLTSYFGLDHATLSLAEDGGESYYVVGSKGYAASGAGSLLGIGDQLIGLVALERRAVRLDIPADLTDAVAVRTIPLPRLDGAGTRIGVPLLDGDQLLGAFAIEHAEADAFTPTFEMALNVAGRQTGLALSLSLARAPSFPSITATFVPQLVSGRVNVVTYYAEDGSLLIGGEFVIKGVAGAVLWRLLSAYVETSAAHVAAGSIAELQALPANTETVLVLLARRLRDCLDFIRLTQIGRGAYLFEVSREITLLEVPR